MILKKLKFVVSTFLLTTLLMALMKPLFLWVYFHLSGGASASDVVAVFVHGLKHDLTLAGYVTALPLLLTLFSLWVTLPERFMRRVLMVYFVLVGLFSSALYAVDLGLYEHWGFRIDATILIYLADPKEAMASVDWATGITQTLLFVVYAALMIGAYRWVVTLFDAKRIPSRKCAFVYLLGGLLLSGLDFLAIRGGVGASVANVSKVYFSKNMFLNHAATNPVFSFVFSLSDTPDFSKEYSFFDDEDCAKKFEALSGNKVPFAQIQRREVLRTQRPNVVVVLMESFARSIMDYEGEGEKLMPNLERYKKEGIWFENMFANSFRTDRGEVAVLSGFPAQTTVSIMKMTSKSRSLPSIAKSLLGAGYSTSFYYGGDLNFTDQASYMYATGWERLVWQQDLSFPVALTKWGYDDRVMCHYFGDEVLRLYEEQVTKQSMEQGQKPFLAGFLTLSSHAPFEIPEQYAYHRHAHPMLNVVQFTDEALGEMLDKWKQSPLWDNLLVVMVADHGYPYPENLEYNSPERHRIPMLWLGGAIKEPMKVDTYLSQIDICASLLGQMGIDHSDFDYSKEVFSDNFPKFGYYAFNNGFGVVDASGEVIWDATSGKVIKQTSPSLLEKGKVMLQTTYRDLSRR